MLTTPVGDLARTLQVTSQTARLSSDLGRLTAELAEGRRSPGGAEGAPLIPQLADIARGLALGARFETALAEAAGRGQAMQAALARVASNATEAGQGLLNASAAGGSPALIAAAAGAAEENFNAAVAALNARFAGVGLFAGDRPESRALAEGADILGQLRASVAGAADAGEVASRVRSFFLDPGGGFETGALLGSVVPMAAVRAGPEAEVGFPVTAADPALRETLAMLALGALAGDAQPDGAEGQRALARSAAEGLVSARGGLAGVEARVGFAEARIAEAQAATAAERFALQRMQNDLLSVDAAETALALEAARGSLETLFTVTARLAQLSLVNFLR